jgi:hypothetical protein
MPLQVSMILSNFTKGEFLLSVSPPCKKPRDKSDDHLPSSLIILEFGLNTMEHLFSMKLNTSDPDAISQRRKNISQEIDVVTSSLNTLAESDEFHKASDSGNWDYLVLPMFPLDKIPNFSENPNNLTELRVEIDFWNQLLNKTLVDLQKKSTCGDRYLTWVGLCLK